MARKAFAILALVAVGFALAVGGCGSSDDGGGSPGGGTSTEDSGYSRY